MKKIYNKSTSFFFFYLMVHGNMLTSMNNNTNTIAINNPQQETLYHNPPIQNNDFLSDLLSQNKGRDDFLSYHGFNVPNQNSRMITLLNNHSTINYNQSKLLSHNSERSHIQSNILDKNYKMINLLDNNNLTPFSCHICNKEYKTQKGLRAHEKAHSKMICFLCNHPGCNKKYISKSGLNEHQKSKHTPEEKKTLVCAFCDKKFPLQGLLNKHVRWGHGETIS